MRKRNKKTAVNGTSSFAVGMPPRIASGGANGPRPTRFIVSIWAGMRAGSARAAAAAAAVAVAATLPFADKSEAVRLVVALIVELDTFPAARPFG
jgi:hypothetical protein